MTTSNKRKLANADGEYLPDIDPTSDVVKVVYLLEWARARGFKVGPAVQVGDVILQVQDLRQIEGRQSRDEPTRDIWQEHGHEDR